MKEMHAHTPAAAALSVRIIDQFLDAVALAYGLAHGAALAARLDYVRVVLAVCTLLAATYAAIAWCDGALRRADRRGRGRADALLRTATTIVVVAQRYTTYVFACVLRAQIGGLFGAAPTLSVRALATPAIVAALAAFVASFVEHYHVEPHVEGVRTPVAFADSFIQAVAFSYGLSGAPDGRFVEAALLVAIVMLACGAARRHADEAAWARTRPTAALFVKHFVAFVEQYTLYVMARLIYASSLVRAGTLSRGAPLQRFARSTLADDAVLAVFVALVVCVATLLDAYLAAPSRTLGASGGGGAPVSEVTRAGRRLVDRLVDAIVVAAAFAHAAALVHAVSMLRICATLGALLVAAYYAEERATGRARAPWRAVAALAALASRYAAYTLIQVVLVRYTHIAASARSIALALADASTPLALVVLLIVVRQNIDDAAAANTAAAVKTADVAPAAAAAAAAADSANGRSAEPEPHVLGDEYDFR